MKKTLLFLLAMLVTGCGSSSAVDYPQISLTAPVYSLGAAPTDTIELVPVEKNTIVVPVAPVEEPEEDEDDAEAEVDETDDDNTEDAQTTDEAEESEDGEDALAEDDADESEDDAEESEDAEEAVAKLFEQSFEDEPSEATFAYREGEGLGTFERVTDVGVTEGSYAVKITCPAELHDDWNNLSTLTIKLPEGESVDLSAESGNKFYVDVTNLSTVDIPIRTNFTNSAGQNPFLTQSVPAGQKVTLEIIPNLNDGQTANEIVAFVMFTVEPTIKNAGVTDGTSIQFVIDNIYVG